MNVQDARVDEFQGFYAEHSESATQGRPRQRRKGKLAGLVDLPIDVLFEIFGHLLPYDLLRVSRTTKQFRRLLIRQSAISVWKVASERADSMPPHPPDMNEPQWANLVFDPHCHLCLAPNVRIIMWEWRLRICVKCTKEHTEEREEDVEINLPPFDEVALVNIIPSRPGSVEGLRRYLVDHLTEFDDGYNALDSAEDRTTYIVQRAEEVSSRSVHAFECEEWATTQQELKQQIQESLREDRLNGIANKLVELGWASEIALLSADDIQDLVTHPLVRKSQKLTPRVWSNIQGFVIQFMEEARERRLAREREQLIEGRKLVAAEVLRKLKNRRLPNTARLPKIMDFCDFPYVQELLSLADGVTLTEEHFFHVMNQLDELLNQYAVDIKTRFVAYICANERHRNASVEPLDSGLRYNFRYDPAFFGHGNRELGVSFPHTPEEEAWSKIGLASTAFSCYPCKRLHDGYGTIPPVLFWPQVLDHDCLTWESVHQDDFVEPAAQLSDNCCRSKWRPNMVKIDYRLSRCAMSVVSAAGKDIDSITAVQMDALTDRFVCLKCLASSESMSGHYLGRAFSWREAVPSSLGQAKWQRLSFSEALDAYNHCQSIAQNQLPSDWAISAPNRHVQGPFWSCAHCRDLPGEPEPMPKDDIMEHLLVQHGKEDPRNNEDYFRSPGCPPKYLTFCPVLLRREDIHNDVTIQAFPREG